MSKNINLSLKNIASSHSYSLGGQATEAIVDGALARNMDTALETQAHLDKEHLRTFQNRVTQLQEGVERLSFILAEVNDVLSRFRSSESF